MSLDRFFFWFGSKNQTARKYPAPQHETIIEPFAGSASYSVLHHHRRVILVDRDARVAALWRYLIRVTARELLALPLLEPGQRVSDLDVSDEARLLISFNVNSGGGGAGDKLTTWDDGCAGRSWGRIRRAKLASQVDKIRHWRIIEGGYESAPDVEATWFIDPPYEGLGKHYRESVAALDLPALGRWCRARRGQIMVCENEGASWLPFRPFKVIRAATRNTGDPEDGISREAIWTNDAEAQATA